MGNKKSFVVYTAWKSFFELLDDPALVKELLIHLGYAPVQIAERLGHESAVITQRYAHLYPSVQKDMANRLDQ